MNTPIYQVETHCQAEEFRAVLLSSGLASRRPVDDLARLDNMLRHANLVLTARIDGQLVGFARSMTDFCFTCYLADLAVSKEVQGMGIGAALVRETMRHLGPQVSLTLNSVPESVDFYAAIGMTRLTNCFRIPREY